jgi:hypothetical protein
MQALQDGFDAFGWGKTAGVESDHIRRRLLEVLNEKRVATSVALVEEVDLPERICPTSKVITQFGIRGNETQYHEEALPLEVESHVAGAFEEAHPPFS